MYKSNCNIKAVKDFNGNDRTVEEESRKTAVFIATDVKT